MTYEFECLKCREHFEQTMSLSEYEKGDKAGFRCPKCQSSDVRQAVSTVMVETSKKS